MTTNVKTTPSSSFFITINGKRKKISVCSYDASASLAEKKRQINEIMNFIMEVRTNDPNSFDRIAKVLNLEKMVAEMKEDYRSFDLSSEQKIDSLAAFV